MPPQPKIKQPDLPPVLNIEEQHHRIEPPMPAPAGTTALAMPQARRMARLNKDGTMTANFIEERLFEGMFLRSQFYQHLLDGKKDINAECGYPPVIMIQQYRELYDREGIAKRVVNVWPQESWSMHPELYEDEDPGTETDFEAAWNELNEDHSIWHWCERIDELSGIGQYGILLLGLDDGLDLAEPADGINDRGEKEVNEDHKIIFIRTFDESVTRVKYREMDPTNPRFGLPTMYTVLFIDLGITGIAQGTDIISKDIHWSRVIHVADNRKMSETYGIPRMQPVYNRLIDLRKILSSSGEMFWKGGFPGISFEVNPDLVDQGATLDPEAMKKQIEAYENGLQRYIGMTGVTAKSLQIQVSDPSSHVQCQLDAIALSLGIPKRVFFGTEEAQLAGAQDADAWNKRVGYRQNTYLTPMLIRPLINRLQCFGVLPDTKKKPKIDWPDLDSPTDKDKAAIALSKTQAMAAYVSGGVDQLMAPKDYLTQVLVLTDDEAETVMDDVEEHASDTPHPNPEEQPGATVSKFTSTGPPKAPAPPMLGQDGQPMVGKDGKPIPGTAKPNPFAKPSPFQKGKAPVGKKPVRNTDVEDEDLDENGEKIKPGPPARGTSTSPGDNGLGQPMPPYSIPPGAGVGGGTPAPVLSGQTQGNRKTGKTKGKGGTTKVPSVNPQGTRGFRQGTQNVGDEKHRPFVENFNPNHDDQGRFADAPGSGGTGLPLPPKDASEEVKNLYWARQRTYMAMRKPGLGEEEQAKRTQAYQKATQDLANHKLLHPEMHVKGGGTGSIVVTPVEKDTKGRKGKGAVGGGKSADDIYVLAQKQGKIIGPLQIEFDRTEGVLNDAWGRASRGAAKKEHIEAMNALMKAKTTANKEILKSLEARNPVATDKALVISRSKDGPVVTRDFMVSHETKQYKQAVAGVDVWNKVVDDRAWTDKGSVLVQTDVKNTGGSGNRSCCAFDANSIALAASDRNVESTTIHELGHALEGHNPAIRQACRDFLARRTANESKVPLRKFSSGYKADETCTPDKFYDPYVGKIYSSGHTEVLSMGIQALVKDPIEFASKDPEHFKLIVRCIHGEIR